MQRFDILSPELDIFQSRIVEASAGTGKTFAIENLFVRILIESKTEITLPEILAVTFTKEAAFEMKTRIRTKLQECKPKDPEAKRRIREALLGFEEIQVFTIHRFCHLALREFAFEAKVPFSVEELDFRAEMRQTVEDFFRTADPQFAEEISLLLKRNRFDLDRLVGQIIEVMQKERGASPLPCLEQLPLVSIEELTHDVEQLAPHYKRFKLENFSSQLETFVQILQKKDLSLLLREKEWFFEKLEEKNAKIKAPPLKSLSLRAPLLWDFINRSLVPYMHLAKDPDEMIKRIGSECRKRWKVKSERSSIWTFDDLLEKMDTALQEKAFLQKVQAKYKVAIIDEFQDTDPLQWKIFEKLFLKKHLLYLVGDPKQSIYGFRSADIYTYMKATQVLGEEKKGFLDTNFRSSPQLVTLLNALFMKNPEWISLPALPSALSYHPVKAGRTEARLQESPFHCFLLEDKAGREKSWPTKQQEEEKLFPYVAQEIVRLHTKEAIAFKEMAILVKDRFQAQRLQLHLQKWGIPSSIKRTFNLTESKGFLAMEILLQALLHPEQESLVLAVLLGPLVCLSQGASHPFFHLQQLGEEKGFAKVYETFLSTQFQGKTVLANLLAQPDLYLEFQQTAEILMEKEKGSCEELLHWMEELKKTDPEKEPRIQLCPGGENGVSILTTFASKGLEFEVVFALGLASRHKEEERNEEKEAEKMRQLYVGLTRAREKLYLPLLFPLEDNSPIEIFFSKWGLSKAEILVELEKMGITYEWVQEISIATLEEKKERQNIVAPPQLELSFPIEWVTSFSSMAQSSGDPLLLEKYKRQDFSKKTLHTLPLGAETGTLIHLIFELLFQNRATSLKQIVYTTLQNTPLAGFEEVVLEMVEEILHLPLLPGFSLHQLKEGDYRQEMEFLFPQEGQLVKGFIDLVFQVEDQIYILDWKSNWLGPTEEDYREEKLVAAMQEHDYFLQAKLYAEAMDRYVKQFYMPQVGGVFYLFLRGKKFYRCNPWAL